MVVTVSNHNSTEAQSQKEPLASPDPVQMKQRRPTQWQMARHTSLQPAPLLWVLTPSPLSSEPG